MHPTTHYIMRDQVRDLVPHLTRPARRGRRFTWQNWFELSVFLLAVSSYVAALTLVA